MMNASNSTEILTHSGVYDAFDDNYKYPAEEAEMDHRIVWKTFNGRFSVAPMGIDSDWLGSS